MSLDNNSMVINIPTTVADTRVFYIELKGEDPDTWAVSEATFSVSKSTGA